MVVHDKSSAEYVEMKVQEILTRNIAIKDRLQMIKTIIMDYQAGRNPDETLIGFMQNGTNN